MINTTITAAARRTRALSCTQPSMSTATVFVAAPVAHVPADLGRGAYNAKGSPPRGELR